MRQTLLRTQTEEEMKNLLKNELLKI